MSLNNPHKTKKSTRVGLRNIKERASVARRRFSDKTGGLGYLAACDYLGESASGQMMRVLKDNQ